MNMMGKLNMRLNYSLETADEDQNIAIHQYLSEEYNILSSGTECQIISAAPYESKYLLIQTECSLLSEI